MSRRVEIWHPKAGVLTRRSRGTVTATPWLTILDQSFDSLPLGDPVSLSTARTALNDTAVGGSGTFSAFGIVSSGSTPAWVWHSPANTFGNGSGSGCATFPGQIFDAYIAANGLILSAAIEYDVTFPVGMAWSLGGKLPGLGGTISGNPPTGGAAPTSTGWSCRSMWRGPGSGTYFGRAALSPNEWVGYRYCIDQAYPGENVWSARSFVAGRTHRIRQEYVMNTVTGTTGNNDGQHRMYFDGEKVGDYSDVTWRSDSTVGINRLLWHFFRGGNTSDWAGSADSDVLVDNLKIQVGV